MEFVPTLALVLLIKKFIDFLKYISAGHWNGAVTQAIVWVSGIGGLFLAAQTQWADGISVGDKALSTLSGPSLVFLGLTLSSIGSTINDTIKSLDEHDTAVIPALTALRGGAVAREFPPPLPTEDSGYVQTKDRNVDTDNDGV